MRSFDYRSAGAYFVTICAAGRSRTERRRFGRIRAADSFRPAPVFEPNDVGEIVTDCWIDIPAHFSTVMIDEFALLPDHFHGIVLIEHQHTGIAFRFSPPAWTRVAPTHTDGGRVSADTSTSDPALHDAGSPSLSVIIGSFKSAVSRISAPVRPPGKLWQRGFHDRIIRDQAELDVYRKYIATNVQRHA